MLANTKQVRNIVKSMFSVHSASSWTDKGVNGMRLVAYRIPVDTSDYLRVEDEFRRLGYSNRISVTDSSDSSPRGASYLRIQAPLGE